MMLLDILNWQRMTLLIIIREYKSFCICVFVLVYLFLGISICIYTFVYLYVCVVTGFHLARLDPG